MLNPPFKLAASAWSASTQKQNAQPSHDACCHAEESHVPAIGRQRLGDLNPHFHCSVIGTCLSTAELRKIMARHIDVTGASDLDLHHQAVSLTGEGGIMAKAIHKALDLKHDAAVQKFSRVRESAGLLALWEASVQDGDIPGAYWALLTHRQVTPELHQRAFGDVHMLSHLVGAANRADIRRLVALEKANAELKDSLEQGQQRGLAGLVERDQTIARLQQELIEARGQLEQAQEQLRAQTAPRRVVDDALLAVQDQRREQAERAAELARAETRQLRDDLQHLGHNMRTMDAELSAAETQLRELMLAPEQEALAADRQQGLRPSIQGRRILYVGGRPSSTPAIRQLVLRLGGEFQHHDGGFEDRKGLLGAAVAGADLVVFPVDCIDHDSAGNLKRQCQRMGVPYLPMRRSSVACFVQTLGEERHEPERPVEPAISHFIQHTLQRAADSSRPS